MEAMNDSCGSYKVEQKVSDGALKTAKRISSLVRKEFIVVHVG